MLLSWSKWLSRPNTRLNDFRVQLFVNSSLALITSRQLVTYLGPFWKKQGHFWSRWMTVSESTFPKGRIIILWAHLNIVLHSGLSPLPPFYITLLEHVKWLHLCPMSVVSPEAGCRQTTRHPRFRLANPVSWYNIYDSTWNEDVRSYTIAWAWTSCSIDNVFRDLWATDF